MDLRFPQCAVVGNINKDNTVHVAMMLHHSLTFTTNMLPLPDFWLHVGMHMAVVARCILKWPCMLYLQCALDIVQMASRYMQGMCVLHSMTLCYLGILVHSVKTYINLPAQLHHSLRTLCRPLLYHAPLETQVVADFKVAVDLAIRESHMLPRY